MKLHLPVFFNSFQAKTDNANMSSQTQKHKRRSAAAQLHVKSGPLNTNNHLMVNTTLLLNNHISFHQKVYTDKITYTHNIIHVGVQVDNYIRTIGPLNTESDMTPC